MVHAGLEEVLTRAVAAIRDRIPGEVHRGRSRRCHARHRVVRRHRIDVDVDNRPSVLVGHVRRRPGEPVAAQPALAAKGPVVVGDVLLGMAVHRPAVVGEVPVIVVRISLVQELDPA